MGTWNNTAVFTQGRREEEEEGEKKEEEVTQTREQACVNLTGEYETLIKNISKRKKVINNPNAKTAVFEQGKDCDGFYTLYDGDGTQLLFHETPDIDRISYKVSGKKLTLDGFY